MYPLRHQREALDFISQREAPHTSEPFSLFRRCIDPRNRTYYEHSVAGCRRPEKQPEDFGGLIADEMGLGKTLTMITAIATTTEQARQFQYGNSRGVEMLGTMKRTRATLVICPAVLLMDGWLEEVSKHVAPGFLKCSKYHGASKASETEILDSDIVLTTYATLITDSSRNSILHRIHWFRIIIDEAHSIRHQQTKQFRAVVALSAKYRWCLTGTPIQNELNDLGALVRFLRVPHLEGLSDFYSHIAGPVEKRNAEGLQRLGNLLRYHRQAIDLAIERGNLSDASSGLFRAILRLRLFCNSGLCVDSDLIGSNKDESLSLLEQGDRAVCSYCSCDVNSVGDRGPAGFGAILSCSHLLCPDIIFSSWKKSIKLAASYLAAHNVPVCVVDGSMTLPERRSKILQFQQDSRVPALLMTLGTGAVGLNLTVANRVHILEPQWNPFIEKQAIGRVMRLGQKKEVTIVRYVVENTVEQVCV
ncbi:uncharacterized protein BDR25DRAFT_374811 [Lindgomyces ingoldianus]|uniref:Uncharacterized protein n=1 Tax=Lindgomyces ingoldianus TaxID=673940 RepID=A0ACB6QMW8_9PLEO|nr:uncharacterized protein BDR25DRAFT_374811 [Lindgomyces ingoldianus]KAF2467496.1 hypothetical protein BDR25DRAFT_374811 [Lindgomyces ingoldianus]